MIYSGFINIWEFFMRLFPRFPFMFFIILSDEILGRGGYGFTEKPLRNETTAAPMFLIIAVLFLVYTAITSYMIIKKGNESKSLLRKLRRQDNAWDLSKIKSRIENAFFKIQKAWMELDPDIAKDVMSDRFYEEHKLQINKMIRDNQKNIRENIKLKETSVVEVVDFIGDTKDSIWVYVKGSKIDYVVDAATDQLIVGDRAKPAGFTELWKLVKSQDREWVIDEIDNQVDIIDIAMFKSSSDRFKTEYTGRYK